MRGRLTIILPAAFFGLVLWGCAHQIVVPRYELTDLPSGRRYVVEGREINKTAGGVTFRDESGQGVTLQSYTEKRIDDAHYTVEYDALSGTRKRVAH